MLDPLYRAVAAVILFFHGIFAGVFGEASGAAWGLSVVFLTITVRILLFPLFVKQIRAQRAMQTLQPQIKALQAKHKGDRETLNRELMALYKESGANPIAGCLPLVLQLPIFFSLFHVLRNIKPELNAAGDAVYTATSGISEPLVRAAANAKIFGAPIASAFTSSPDLLRQLGDANPTVVKVVSSTMIVLMGLTTFITQRQMMARATTTDPQQLMVQRVLLYVLPFSFAIFGFNFPVGVLLYWLTTNVWSMAQQQYVIRRMPQVPGSSRGTADGRSQAGSGPRPPTEGPQAKAPASQRNAAGSRPRGGGSVVAGEGSSPVSLAKPGATSTVRTGPPRRGKQSRAKRRGRR